MTLSIASLSLVVREYDEAIAFFTQALHFSLLEDTPLGDGKRWVMVAPPGCKGAALLLARADTPERTSLSAIKREGASFSSCIPATSGVTIVKCNHMVSCLLRNQGWKPTVLL
jgi:catechol 2,3-dioxygenase-like lactoylglutathione lyase family enzyme